MTLNLHLQIIYLLRNAEQGKGCNNGAREAEKDYAEGMFGQAVYGTLNAIGAGAAAQIAAEKKAAEDAAKAAQNNNAPADKNNQAPKGGSAGASVHNGARDEDAKGTQTSPADSPKANDPKGGTTKPPTAGVSDTLSVAGVSNSIKQLGIKVAGITEGGLPRVLNVVGKGLGLASLGVNMYDEGATKPNLDNYQRGAAFLRAGAATVLPIAAGMAAAGLLALAVPAAATAGVGLVVSAVVGGVAGHFYGNKETSAVKNYVDEAIENKVNQFKSWLNK